MARPRAQQVPRILLLLLLLSCPLARTEEFPTRSYEQQSIPLSFKPRAARSLPSFGAVQRQRLQGPIDPKTRDDGLLRPGQQHARDACALRHLSGGASLPPSSRAPKPLKPAVETLGLLVWLSTFTLMSSASLIIFITSRELTWPRSVRMLVASASIGLVAVGTEHCLQETQIGCNGCRHAKPHHAAFKHLSEALQGTVMAAVSMISVSGMWAMDHWLESSVTKLATVPVLSLSAIPAPVLASIFYVGAAGREPAAVHLWVPFFLFIAPLHVLFRDLLDKVSFVSFGGLLSGWAVLSTLISGSLLLLQSERERVLALNGHIKARTRKTFESMVGLQWVVWSSVLINSLWCCLSLFWWSFNGISVRWGLGAIAVMTNLMELTASYVATRPHLAAVPASQPTEAKRIARFTFAIFSRLSRWAVVQASWRAFWIDSDVGGCKSLKKRSKCLSRGCSWKPSDSATTGAPGGAAGAQPSSLSFWSYPSSQDGSCQMNDETRVQRQFVSVMATYLAYAAVGTLQGDYLRAVSHHEPC